MKSYSMVSDEFLSQQRLLVIAPHADDEYFGCAGSMARIKKLGGEVYVVVVSVGDLQHYGDKEEYQFVKGSQRKEELGRASHWPDFGEEERKAILDTLQKGGGCYDVIYEFEKEFAS